MSKTLSEKKKRGDAKKKYCYNFGKGYRKTSRREKDGRPEKRVR